MIELNTDLVRNNLISFCVKAKKWCMPTNEGNHAWKMPQWKSHHLAPTRSVRSHQLEENMQISSKNWFGKQVPHRSLTTATAANQEADNKCIVLMRHHKQVNAANLDSIQESDRSFVYIALTLKK